jgi:hypothetical protein
MSGKRRRLSALIGVTVLVTLLRPPPPPGERRLDRPGVFSWPWHKAKKEALLRAELELQEALCGVDWSDRPSDPDRLAFLPGVKFLLYMRDPDAYAITALQQDPVGVDVTHDTAVTSFVARMRVLVDGVEIAVRERHTHRWTWRGGAWRLADADVAVFVP